MGRAFTVPLLGFLDHNGLWRSRVAKSSGLCSAEAKEVLKSTGSKFVAVELDELPAEEGAAMQDSWAVVTRWSWLSDPANEHAHRFGNQPTTQKMRLFS